MSIKLNVPDLTELKPKITVIGVGGAGGNAINNMISTGLSGVDFVAANTDAQALQMSSAPHRIQIGVNLTEGLGAGSQPDIGEAAAEEALEEIRAQIDGSHMVFVAAGMGGGTGTGAAPVIARVAHDKDILTVGVVTKPFHFEGQRRMNIAEAGIVELEKHVDTLIVIPNQNLFRIANEKTTFAEAFRMADQVLHSGIACITDLIVKEGLINLDFADVRAVMNEMGAAMMGTGEASGERRALEAAEEAIANPLLDDVSMDGAKGLLISITGSDDLTLYEVDEAATRIRQEVDPSANVIVGATFDGTLDGSVRVSIVASGVGKSKSQQKPPVQDSKTEPETRLANRLMDVHQIVNSGQPAPQEPAKPQGNPNPTWQGPGDVRIEQRPPNLPQLSEPKVPPAPPPVENQAQPFAPAQPANMKRPPTRMPGIEDLPPVAQKEILTKGAQAPDTGIQAHKKKAGFFERLASVGRSSKRNDSPEAVQNLSAEQQISPTKNDKISRSNPHNVTAVNKLGPPPPVVNQQQAPQQPSAQAQQAVSVENAEDIEIPEFFKRKANQ